MTDISQHQVLEVSNFQNLISSSFQGVTNAMCWKRNLLGNFNEIVNKITIEENMATLCPEQLIGLELSEQGQLARNIILRDWEQLKFHGASPSINLIKCYDRDDSYPFFPTDVYSYHVDRSPIEVDTFLCTYLGESSEILANAQAQQKINIPEIRCELKKLDDGESESFESFLSDHFFDLHYQTKPAARPINLGRGNLWKLAVDHPGSQVLPCIHRAPKEKSGQTRLMMIC